MAMVTVTDMVMALLKMRIMSILQQKKQPGERNIVCLGRNIKKLNLFK
jgi:hypothetical protein